MHLTELKHAPNLTETTATLAEWLYTEWGQYLEGRSLEITVDRLEKEKNAEGIPFTLVAIDDENDDHAERPVGTARIVAADMDTHPELTPWMASVFVHPAGRGQRVGTQLCAGIVQQALKLGYTELYLFTPDRATFYQRQGWKTISEELYNGELVSIMRLELSEYSG